MRSFRTAAAILVSAALLISTCACQSGSSVRDEETEEETSEITTESDRETSDNSGGLADIVNGILNGDGNEPESSAAQDTTEPVSAVQPPATSQTEQTTAASTTAYDTDPAVIDVAHSGVPSVENPDLDVTKRIKWMSWAEMDETTAAAELFKEVYGIPATGDDPTRDGRIFDFISVPYLERYDKLAAAIQSGNSPDLFPFDISDFPYGAIYNRYQPLDELLNFNSAKWSGSKEAMDQFAIKGKHYCAFTELQFNSLLYYRRSVVEDAGLEDPRTLFENDKWTWDTFLDMARKFQRSGDNKFIALGYNTDANLLATTGTPLISIENGRLVNNMNSVNVQRAMDLLQTLQSENLRWPLHENGWALNTKAWAQGDILFYADGGTWSFEASNGLNVYAKKFAWPDDEICVVPYPRDPQADKYYHAMKQDALMWCKGSTNADGVAAWIDCAATASLDPAVAAAAIQVRKDNYGWTDSNLDFIYSLTAMDGTSVITPVFDFKNGIGEDIADAGKAESPVESLFKTVYITGDKTYSQLYEDYFATIDERINELNQKLGTL